MTYIRLIAAAAFAAMLLPLSAHSADMKIVQPPKTNELKKNAQYYVRVSCTARSANSSEIKQSQMLNYMRSLSKNGNFAAKLARGKTKVFHTVTLSTKAPKGSNFDGEPKFEVPGQVLHIPVFVADRKLNNAITTFYDGTGACPDKLFFVGDNEIFLTGVFFHSNETKETPVLADIATFLAESWPQFRFLVFKDEVNAEQQKRVDQVEPLAKAVTKLINGFRASAFVTKPVLLREGTTQVSTSLTTVTITVTKYSNFLRSPAPFRDNFQNFVPTDAKSIDTKEPSTTINSCRELDNQIADAGLVAAPDRAYVLFTLARTKGLSKVDLVRCLGVDRLAQTAADTNHSKWFDSDAKWRISEKDIEIYTRNYPNEIPRPGIVDIAANKNILNARKEALRVLIDLLVHRTRVATNFEDLASDIQNHYQTHVSHLLEIRDETEVGLLKLVDPKAGSPFVVLKSLSDNKFQRYGCTIFKENAEKKEVFGKSEMGFFSFKQEYVPRDQRKDNPLVAANAVLMLPRFDENNKLAEIVATESRIEDAINLAGDCIPDS